MNSWEESSYCSIIGTRGTVFICVLDDASFFQEMVVLYSDELTLEKIEGTIKNGKSRETGNTVY